MRILSVANRVTFQRLKSKTVTSENEIMILTGQETTKVTYANTNGELQYPRKISTSSLP